MVAYATLADLKEHMDVPDSASDAQLQDVLDASARWIESPAGCGRVFALDTSDATKVFNPSLPGLVDVADLVTITSIKLDRNGDRTYSTTLTTSDYQLLPLNAPQAQQIVSWSRSSYQFSPGQLVQIIGKFGYVEGGALGGTTGSTPAAVKEANLLLAARFFKRREAPFGMVSSVDLGTFTRLAAADPDVATLLLPYSRSKLWVLA